MFNYYDLLKKVAVMLLVTLTEDGGDSTNKLKRFRISSRSFTTEGPLMNL